MASTHSLVGKWAWNEFGGECVDARRAIPGWNEPECTTGTWTPVEETAAPQTEATAQACPRNRIGQVIPMVACTTLGTNVWELDFGTNLTGWLRLRLPQLKPGEKVVMSYADKRFQPAGSDDTPAGKIGPATTPKTVETPKGPINYQTFNQFDEFISAGKTGEQFCSKFNYHGFRYVIVEGVPVPPAPGDAEALLIESDLEPAGDFSCSNDLFNRIHQANLWTIRNLNLGGYMVDCPHRERLGYGDGQVGIESQVMNLQAAAFYGKWAVDWLDAQKPFNGEMPHTAPDWGGGGGPAWGGTGCVLPWKLYLYYGDQRLLEHAYESMRRYVAFLEGRCENDVLRRYGGEWDFIGDWVPPGRGMDTSNWPGKPAAELFNNCYRVYLWQILERSARALGKTEDAESCAAKLTELRPPIHAAFYDASKQLYVLDEQSYQVMPLLTGIVPDDLRGAIQKKLEDIILLKGKGHLDTGMLGTYFLIQYLQESGHNDLLHTLFNQTTYPGWGYMLSQGATTFWEQWNGYWSQIHSCFTSPGGWFYQGLAGIRPDASAPGFKKIIIAPAVVGDLTWVKCGYDSSHGRIVSNWRRDGDTLSMEVTIPANTTAMVSLPGNATAPSTIQESGKTVWSNSTYVGGIPGITGASVKADRVDIAIGSGTYNFLVTGRG
jgi:alpha-L-rhamnosidase